MLGRLLSPTSPIHSLLPPASRHVFRLQHYKDGSTSTKNLGIFSSSLNQPTAQPFQLQQKCLLHTRASTLLQKTLNRDFASVGGSAVKPSAGQGEADSDNDSWWVYSAKGPNPPGVVLLFQRDNKSEAAFLFVMLLGFFWTSAVVFFFVMPVGLQFEADPVRAKEIKALRNLLSGETFVIFLLCASTIMSRILTRSIYQITTKQHSDATIRFRRRWRIFQHPTFVVPLHQIKPIRQRPDELVFTVPSQSRFWGKIFKETEYSLKLNRFRSATVPNPPWLASVLRGEPFPGERAAMPVFSSTQQHTRM
eukprot:gnl/Hemi2/3855_TR1353_c0_g6_i1.p1 gnl/Hemi2/3855_TR1353_c0_g6~~gnl/Hemi2/3855_TR1353_c0_g6_i1.p1  ORF type:complete len:307 (+),score=28.25 gnl/Hemi2/3855_TR1353_c0_g6_i1:117-1037(+)